MSISRHSILVLAAFAAGSSLFASSPYISRVLEYRPAPGQFVNVVPEVPAGATPEEVNAIVLGEIGHEESPGMVSLGAFGGYVVFGFDHPVVNVPGEYDFKIYGNAIISNKNLNGGSCEPGIVMVSADVNGNGLADDEWYELAGSEYGNPDAVRGFTITYHKPGEGDGSATEGDKAAADDPEYIRFTTNDPSLPEGYVPRNAFHKQSYWPEWIDGDELTFSGTRLPDNGVDVSGTGTSWVLKAFPWGYADNLPNKENPGFDIGWAVDAEGNPVELQHIDFVKVYTAECQACGWVGETSTEVCGAEDLHPEAVATSVSTLPCDPSTSPSYININGETSATPWPGLNIIRSADGTWHKEWRR